jgi:hypothetical protein
MTTQTYQPKPMVFVGHLSKPQLQELVEQFPTKDVIVTYTMHTCIVKSIRRNIDVMTAHNNGNEWVVYARQGLINKIYA